MFQAALPPTLPQPLWFFPFPQCTMLRMLLSTGLRKFLPVPLPAHGILSCFLSLPVWDSGSPNPQGLVTLGGHGWVVMPMGAQPQRWR